MSNIFSRSYKKNIVSGFFIAATVIVFALVFFFGVWSATHSIHKIAHLDIDINGKKRAFEGEVTEGMTILHALQASAIAGNLSFNFTVDGGKLIVKSLDGYSVLKNDEELSLYLNSSAIETDKIQSILIKAGDRIMIDAK